MRIALATGRANEDRKIGPHEFNISEKRPPHGLGFMMAILQEEGHQVDIMDRYAGDLTYTGDFSEFDLLGIYSSSICMDDIRKICLKSHAGRLAVGGPHWSIFPRDGLGEVWRGHITNIVIGEGEHIIGSIAQGAIVNDVVSGRLTNAQLDRLPRFPWRYFWEEKKSFYHWGFPFHPAKPVFTMNTSRGCPFSCKFCSTKKVWGNHVTMMSPYRIVDDIEYLQRMFDAKGIYFREDNFTVNRSRVLDFCDLILRRGIKISWACETRADTVSRDIMNMMAAAGCVGFYVGVEHGSQRILDLLGKGITVEQIEQFFSWSHEFGIRTAASMIISHPEETEEDKKAFWDLLNKIKPSMQWHNHYRKEG